VASGYRDDRDLVFQRLLKSILARRPDGTRPFHSAVQGAAVDAEHPRCLGDVPAHREEYFLDVLAAQVIE
jgi:hypothetical protein